MGIAVWIGVGIMLKDAADPLIGMGHGQPRAIPD